MGVKRTRKKQRERVVIERFVIDTTVGRLQIKIDGEHLINIRKLLANFIHA